MRDVLGQEYVRRLQNLRKRFEGSLRNLEVHRVSPDGPVMLPEPESHRPYSPGDNPGYIDWNLYARTDRYFVKSMLREKENTMSILLDVSSSMSSPFPEKMEAAREIAGAIAYISLCAGNQVRLVPWSAHAVPSQRDYAGERSALDLLRHLSRIPGEQAGAPTDLHRSLSEVMSGPETEDSWILVISDLIDMTPYENLVKALAMRSAKFGAIQVLAPEEIRPTVRGHLQMTDPETGDVSNRVVGYRSLRRMSRMVADFMDRTRRRFTDNGGSFTLASSEDPFEKAVMSFLVPAGDTIP